jgi:Xaa-Pro aminopeptidase
VAKIFHAYLYVELDKTIVFLDGSKLDESVSGYLQEVGVERRDFVEIWNFLHGRGWAEGKVCCASQLRRGIN